MASYQKILPLLAVLLFLGGCSETMFASHMAKQIPMPGDARNQGNFKVGNPYNVMGQQYYPTETYDYVETGIASWYGPGFHGNRTANGERFDTNELTAAHKTLQMPSLVRVTNLENGRSLVVRVNDRGPYSRGRVMDVSSKAAELLGFKNVGTAKVRLEVLADESRKIAQAAREGRDTRGYEVALNRSGAPKPTQIAHASASAPPPGGDMAEALEPIQVASVEKQALPPIQGHVASDGRFLPDPVVSYQPVHPTSIYVQAGAFANQENATRLSAKLASVGKTQIFPATVGGKTFYRVRVGPFATVDQADTALSRVIANGGNKAIIVVN